MSLAQETVASSLGYISIACWLCAQLPQVVKNITLQSCEGLSLPFLINWLFGDLTNLIGCILTDQLPFQTYLATYFCIIDFTLCIQYFYYLRPTAKSQHHHHHVHYASIPTTAITSPAQTSPQAQSSSLTSPSNSPIHVFDTNTHTNGSSSSSATVQPRNKRKHSHGPPYPNHHVHNHGHGHGHGYRSQSTSQLFGADLGNLGMTSPLPPNATDSYLDLYAAALDVARAAERVSSRRSESRKARLSRQTTSNTMSNLDEDGGDGGGMMDSFHSELSAQSRTSSHHDLEERKKISQSTGNLDRGRGRNMRRDLVLSSPMPNTRTIEGEDEDRLDALPTGTGVEGIERPGIGRSKSRSLSVVRTQSGKGKGRRAAGVAFMSLGLLARFGGMTPQLRNHGVGRVLEKDLETTSTIPIRHPQPFLFGPNPYPNPHPYTSPASPSNYMTTIQLPEGEETYKAHDHHEDPAPEPPSFKRLFGRTSAWACTTLYLTSRLPQIWKNFMRKSVEGLSIFLFFFAFCGNLTYVASILLNPAGSASPSDAGHYLLEALPYLLGSGGTLLFDMTIMIQSFMYGSAPPIPDAPSIITRRKNRRKRTTPEDGLNHHHHNHSIGNGNGNGKEERQPLLPSPMVGRDRDRSISPEQVKRAGEYGR